jgi:protein required for attachment to host cells
MKDVVWALVMSSTEARIIKGIARGAVEDMPEQSIRTEHKDLSDIMSDKPGRSFSSVGSARSAMEYASDPVKDAKRAFVDEAVTLLHRHFVQHDFTHLAIFAGPEMLGLLRDGLPADLQHAVVAEIPKNLLHETPHDLRRIVIDHVFTKG